jgi:hypothetical protein
MWLPFFNKDVLFTARTVSGVYYYPPFRIQQDYGASNQGERTALTVIYILKCPTDDQLKCAVKLF